MRATRLSRSRSWVFSFLPFPSPRQCLHFFSKTGYLSYKEIVFRVLRGRLTPEKEPKQQFIGGV